MSRNAYESSFHEISPGFERERLQAARSSAIKNNAGSAAALVLIVVVAIFSLPLRSLAQQPTASPTADLPPGSMQAKATTACLECHEARIILQQRLSKAAWTKEVDKMTKWGAVVDPADRDALIDYLSANFTPDKPAYEPPRTTPGKSAKTSK